VGREHERWFNDQTWEHLRGTLRFTWRNSTHYSSTGLGNFAQNSQQQAMDILWFKFSNDSDQRSTEWRLVASPKRPDTYSVPDSTLLYLGPLG
jgi:hypothetical protein